MLKQHYFSRVMLGAIGVLATLPAASAVAQTPAPAKAAASTADSGETQRKLLDLLRVSPTLSAVVANDPTLLSNQDYVSHNNPELAQFIVEHPEVARNPAFYLFSHLNKPGQPDYQVMRPKWAFGSAPDSRREVEVVMDQVGPVLALICFAVMGLWLMRVISDSRRWGRLLKLQSEVHGKLIDRFSSNQELLAYMQTDAGKRFLEAAPLTTESQQQRVPNVVGRVLMTLQAGVVMVLLGAGLLFIRNSVEEGATALLILGVVILMPGIGFTISAGMTWVLAGRLGLMPARTAEPMERQ